MQHTATTAEAIGSDCRVRRLSAILQYIQEATAGAVSGMSNLGIHVIAKSLQYKGIKANRRNIEELFRYYRRRIHTEQFVSTITKGRTRKRTNI